MNFGELFEISQEISFDPYKLWVANKMYLQVRHGDLNGRKWYISKHMVKSEVVQTAFLAIRQFQEHELREGFRYRGKAIFNPHIDVDAILQFCDQLSVR